jgi:hypothetical protein
MPTARSTLGAVTPRQLIALSTVTAGLYLLVSVSQPYFSTSVGRRPALAVYYLATIGLFSSYGWILSACRRKEISAGALSLLLASPIAFQSFWVATAPVLSIDLYSYLMDSFSARLGLNPYTSPPRDLGYTSFGLELGRHGWRPTHGPAPYGPLWMMLMVTLGRTGVGLWVAIVFVKGLMAAANAGCTMLIYLLLKRVRPEAALVGAMAYWWNPLVLIEAAGEGHNDPLMALLVLLAIWLTIRHRFVLGALALMAGVLTKYVPVVFGPAVAIYQWRSSANRQVVLQRLLGTGILCAVMAALAFAPFWAGWSTFAGVQESAQRKFTNGTSGALFWALSHLAGAMGPTYLTQIVLSASLVGVVLHATRSVRDHHTLLTACTTISIFYVLVASPRFWPWYVMLPTALLCASGRRRDIALAFAWTACARAVAPLDVIRLSNAISWPTEVWATTIIGVWVPAVTWIGQTWASGAQANVTRDS